MLVVVALVASMLVTFGAPGVAITSFDDTTDNETAPEYDITFPVVGDYNYSDTWGAPRSHGRTHKGSDIFADKGTPVVAVADGTVIVIAVGQRAGRYIAVRHEGGWTSYYMHLDNDTPGTDDGLGGAPAEGIAVGVQVKAGDVLDYVGDSGNAETTPPHLHFEIRDHNGTATNPYPYLRHAEGKPVEVLAPEVLADSNPRYPGVNVKYVGRLDPGRGFSSDIAVHDATAYLGTWGRPNACPATGVRLIDVTDPTEPAALGAIAAGNEFPRTSTDSVWVGAVETTAFEGDLAVVAVRLCDTAERSRRGKAFRGLAMYNVTDPAAPVLLGTIDTGRGTQGVHEIDLVARPDGSLLAAVTVLQSNRHTVQESGDLRLVDLSDPSQPVEIADWDLRRDGPGDLMENLTEGVYDDLELHAHSATWSTDGSQLWVSNWDAGIVLLDTANPTSPQFVTSFGYDPESEGNAHSVAIDEDRGILIRSDQDLVNADRERHKAGWSGQRIYDISDPNAVEELSRFVSERAVSNEDGGAAHVDGRYSAHNALIDGDLEYVAWYSDGLRIVDVSDPAEPVEVGSFVPPRTADPQRYWNAPDGSRAMAMVWGVELHDGLIYVSDMNSGLWILKYSPPVEAVEFPGK